MRSGCTFSGPDRKTAAQENGVPGCNGSHCRGTIAVVGIGPGSLDDMTPRARQAIEKAEVIVGYDTYIKLIETMLTGKTVLGSAMMQEIDRCQKAVELAKTGSRVAVVSSGDPGVYGMAGLVQELVLQEPEKQRPEVEIIPGISAVGAAAAVLGAPLMHDFAVISLSDLLTPWELIVKRVEAVAAADFVVALYNPKSIKRTAQIETVREIMLKHRAPETPVGIVQNASRDNEHKVLSNLRDFTQEHIDMFSLVIIGNSQTFACDDKMVTPRGYRL